MKQGARWTVQTYPELDGLQQAALAAAHCILKRRSIPKVVQEELTTALGVPEVVKLVVLCGFYEIISGVIFAFDVPLPEVAADPFRING